jgi:hypothetical protein
MMEFGGLGLAAVRGVAVPCAAGAAGACGPRLVSSLRKLSQPSRALNEPARRLGAFWRLV